MSTKISALDERAQSDIIGDEFFPIIDGGTGTTTATTGYQTFKIKLDTLFLSGQGYEKLTDVSVVQGATFDDDATIDFIINGVTTPTALDGNKFFTLQYTDEAGQITKLKIQKYVIENGDVKFEHIDTTDLVTSDQRISENANSIANNKLVTAAAVDEHILHIEDLLFDNSDSKIKEYFGDSTTSRNSGTHVLKEFRLNSEVTQDFINLQNGATTLTTFKAVEEEFDVVGVDLELKIATSQVNNDHFRIDSTQPNLNNRLNIRNLGIRRELIADNAINFQKISNRGILNTNISNEAINTRTILNDAVITEKIRNGAITPTKISANGPSWDASNVNIPNGLNVADNVIVNGNISQKGTTFSIFNSSRSSTTHSGRALVHTPGNRLTINEVNDFDGGVIVRGIVTVPSMNLTNIVNGGSRAVVTKEYVDRADILLNPIGEDKIQDNAIEIRHMTDNSVDTPEIVDEAITSPKIELIGPHWDNTGKVQVSGDLDVAGTTTTIGESGSSANLILSTRGGTTGFAQITRNNGPAGDLLIKNVRGDIKFGTTGGSADLTIGGTATTIDKRLTITGTGATTINGTNFINPALLIGSSLSGIAIDQNEIVQKGNHLNLGVAETTGQNIFFKAGNLLRATIHGDSGDIQATGDLITNTGIVRTVRNDSRLHLRGGTENNTGADIQLHGTNNASNSYEAFYNAKKHTFKSADGANTILEINTVNRKVTLSAQGTDANHLITKNYVDTKEIAPSDLTDHGPQWDSTKVFIPNNLEVTDIATVGDNLSVGGQITQSGSDFKLYNTARAAGNTHAGRALVHAAGDKLTINYAGDYSGGVEVRGKVIASDQTTAIINSNNKALTTKEYVATEIAKVHPDLSYVAVGGDNMTGDLTWNTQSGNGLAWSNNTDKASIRFYNTSDTDTNSRLEFEIGDNNNEFFRFIMNPTGTTENVELLKIANTEFSYKGNTIFHEGNDGAGSGLDADKLDGLDASSFAKPNTNISVSTPTSDSHAATKKYVDDKEFKLIQTKDDITTRTESGFYESNTATKAEGWPEDSGSWQHLISSTHSNTNNYYALQIASNFYNQEFYFRNTHGNGKKEWSKVWHSNNVGAGSGLDADKLDGKQGSYYLDIGNLTGTIPDSRLPDVITPMTSVQTREIKAGNSNHPTQSTSQELILNAGESSGKVPNQVNEYVYVNAEGGLSVNTPKVSNWQGGAAGGFNETIITGKAISIGGSKVFHAGNDGSGSGLDADKLDGLHASSFAKPNTNISVSAPTSNSHAATKKYVDDTCHINQLDILKSVYPVGVLYTSVSGTNPNSIFGFGTWVEYGKGRMPVGVDTADSSFKTSGKTGGAKTHKLTTNEMPSHRHTGGAGDYGSNVFAHGHTSGSAPSSISTTSKNSNTVGFTTYTGGNAHHNNMPPYITIYMWRRTA